MIKPRISKLKLQDRDGEKAPEVYECGSLALDMNEMYVYAFGTSPQEAFETWLKMCKSKSRCYSTNKWKKIKAPSIASRREYYESWGVK